MRDASLFKTNKTQAVRLTKDVAFPEAVSKVTVTKLGKARLLAPANMSWDSFFDAEPASADFMDDREQPHGQDRDGF